MLSCINICGGEERAEGEVELSRSLNRGLSDPLQTHMLRLRVTRLMAGGAIGCRV